MPLPRPLRALRRLTAVLLGTVVLSGCGVQLATVPRSDGRAPSALRPEAGRALLVLVGTSFRVGTGNREANEGVRVADDRGHVVGELAPGLWLALGVEPGRRCFHAWHDVYGGAPDVATLCGDVVAGRTYFARVGQSSRESWGGPLSTAWQVGNLLDGNQDPARGRVLEPALARETEERFADRIARVRRDGEAAAAAGRYVALGEGFALERDDAPR